MQPNRRLLFCFLALCLIALCLLSWAAWAAPPSQPALAQGVPVWVVSVAGGVILLLLGAAGWLLQRWMMRREQREDQILARFDSLDRRMDQMSVDQARTYERIDGLPCRKDRRGGGGGNNACVILPGGES